MSRFLKIVAILVIASGLYLGIRYFGSVIHYACANPVEDCAPPINAIGQAGFYATGGEFVPLFTH
jgi:hypothetical protein